MAVPFSIRCVSCNGRLRVTDESIVGSIVGCPRCGSMVQINPPEQPSVPSGPTENQRPPARQPLTPPTPPPLIAGEEMVDSQELTQEEVSFQPPVQTSAESGVESSSAAEDPQWLNEGDWTREPSRRIRKGWMLAIAATGGVIVAALLAAYMFGQPAGPETAEKLEPASEVTPGKYVETPAEESIDPVLPADVQSVADDLQPGPDEPSTPTSEPETRGEDAVAAEAAPPTSPGSLIPTDLLPTDVLGADAPPDPRRTNTDKRIIPIAASDGSEQQPLMDLPPELKAFTMGLFDRPGNAPDAIATSAPDAAVEELMVDRAADAGADPMLLATPPPEVNVDNALQLGIAIQTDGYPLAAFVLEASALTTMPIQIDWVTLDLANVSLSQRVRDAKPGFKPIGNLLDSIAAEAGVVFEREENRLFMTLSEADLKARVQDLVALGDFGDEQDATKKWVAQFVESTQWNERERLGLRALVTDSLRRARSIPSRMPELAQSHWTVIAECLAPGALDSGTAPENFHERWPLLVGGDSGPQLDTSTTLAGLLRQTSRRNSTTCVVNWDDARQRRLSPGQLVMPFAGQPAGEMLGETLAPMGLQVRVADASHWWVGTAATYDRMPLLVIGDELGPRRDEILQRIDQAAERADTLILIKHDPVSDRYLSLMPRFLYRQLPTILKPFRPPVIPPK